MTDCGSLGTTFRHGNPLKVFDTASPTVAYDVAPDAKRFLVIKDDATEADRRTRSDMITVLNWFEELKRLRPTN